MELDIAVGNSAWWLVIAVGILITVLVYRLLGRKSEEQKRKALLYIGCGILVLFYVQRFFMFRYDAYIAVYGTGWKCILTELLPLNLCYFSVLLMIFGGCLNKKYLLEFCFYISFLGAMFALAAPVEVFTNTDLLSPAVTLFYILHILVAAVYCNIGLLGLVEINIKRGTVSIFILGVIGFLAHLVNLLGRTFGISNMNYFYTFDTEGSAILELFWEWLPVPYLYLVIPTSVIFGIWIIVLTLCCKCVIFLKKKLVKTIE